MIQIYPDKKELKQIYNKYRGLLRVCRAYLSEDEIKLVRQAFKMAVKVYMEKKQESGELYIYYALAVAKVVVEEISLGTNSIIGALLHEAVAESKIGLKEIELKFGKNVSQIIKGLNKISGLNTTKTSLQAENFRKLLLTLAKDMRVILIKLADRLQYMRLINNLPREKQLKISSETFYLYAPLAHRLGLYNMKSELEDLALRYTETKIYRSITQKLRDTKDTRNKFIREFIKPIKEALANQEYNFEIKGRPKSVYSIWSKMKKQDVEFEEVYDLFAIRIILNNIKDSEKADCWHVYSIVTDFYRPNPQRLRDWISIPKTNAYESLHTTVVGPGGKWVEIQIRTKRMNEIAEKGFAAHWKYKCQKGETQLDEWLGKVREILEAPEPDGTDFIDNVKLSLYSDEVFIFTPMGELKKFPLGATVLDFAFEIHTGVGSTCVGAKVNHKNVPIKHILNNGDQVEIITSKNQKPNAGWLNFVVTSKAKSKIRQAIQKERFKEGEKGKELLRRKFKNWKVKFNDENINKLLKQFKLKTSPELYYLIAIEKIDLSEIKEFITASQIPEPVKPSEKEEETFLEKPDKPVSVRKDDCLIFDDKLANVDYKLAQCCNPVYGDEIFGFVTVGEGVKIHRINCPNANQMLSKYGYRMVRVKWTPLYRDVSFETVIKVKGIDEILIVNKISGVISKDLKVNMRSISVEANDGMFEGTIKLYVKDINHLEVLIKKLNKVKGVLKAFRLEHD